MRKRPRTTQYFYHRTIIEKGKFEIFLLNCCKRRVREFAARVNIGRFMEALGTVTVALEDTVVNFSCPGRAPGVTSLLYTGGRRICLPTERMS